MERACQNIGIFFALFLGLLLSFSSCDQKDSVSSGKIKIVATTGIVADLVKNITGDRAEVTALMGPGVDPHLYRARQGDLVKLEEAEIIVYNGLHLEGKMTEILEKIGRKRKEKVISLAEGLSSSDIVYHQEVADPHIWFDVSVWKKCGKYLSSRLSSLYPEHAEVFSSNYEEYAAVLDTLHEETKLEIGSIPAEQRVMITSHDAFSYFGRAYSIEVRALQGISTAAEYGLRDITEMTRFITERRIRAVFVESSVSPQSIESVIEGCARRGFRPALGGNLFSDSMGESGSPEGTYTGMIRHNVRTIVNALK